ncbi:hypothetical protein BJ165DRAFT_301607 [Panaeolus papilionaceus]|nr:hypothetical protein BJ165DRAFT_301607 [Panaeolus papilionaceus]
MPHPDPYPISTSPHQTTFSPHDEGAYIPTIPSESSPLLPTQPQLPRPGFFDEDTAHWEWEPHRLMSGSSYFVCGVKWSGGVRRVVTDLDMSREDVRRSVGEFVRMKIGGGSVEVVPYTSGTSGATGGGDIDLDGEWYVRELEDPERIAALLEIQRQRQGTDDENGTSTNGKLLKKGRTKKKRRSTMPAPPVLLLEMWSVDHVQRRATRWGDERRDYESGGETVGYGSMGSTGPWGWKGKSTSHGDTAEENEEDALDSAYRYWLYVDSHPSHVGLPAHAREEALEILEWAWTDGVLPASGAASHFSSTPGRPKSGVIAPEGGQRVSFAKPPPLFGQEECDELRKALLAFEDEGHHDQSHGKKRPSLSISTGGRSTPSHGHTHSHSHSLSQSYPYCQSYPSSQPQAQNRLIARIFLRLLGWRQAHFRSDLPLPSSAFDVPYPPLPPYALPVSRETQEREIGARERARERRQSVFLPSKQNKTSWAKITRDFVGLVLCLGIPYLFVKRAVVDRENGERGVSSTVNLNGATGYVLPRREGEGTVGMFIMWGVTCVLAATTLSLSIALITLPASDPSQGSDRWSFTIPRIAALVALIFAVASLIASGVVIWRHSHEHHHLHNRRDSMGGRRRTLPLEGVVVKETLIPSLPIVFLAYAIMALVFAVVMFLVKNGTFTHKGIDTSSMVGDFIDEKIGQIGGGEWRKFSLLLFGGAVGAMVGIGYVVLWG